MIFLSNCYEKPIFLIAFLGIALFPIDLFSQSEPPLWMIKDYNRNFYDIQADFNKYWEGKVITKETPREERMGWKQFKRWEWFWEQRVAPSGVFPNPGHTYMEYFKYREQKSKQKIENKPGDWTFLVHRVLPWLLGAWSLKLCCGRPPLRWCN